VRKKSSFIWKKESENKCEVLLMISFLFMKYKNFVTFSDNDLMIQYLDIGPHFCGKL
jgi:hypothetical protein